MSCRLVVYIVHTTFDLRAKLRVHSIFTHAILPCHGGECHAQHGVHYICSYLYIREYGSTLYVGMACKKNVELSQ